MSDLNLEDSMSLLSANHLSYESASSVCAASQRQLSLINFQPRNYNGVDAGTQLSLVFNAGSSFTYGPTSTLNITMTVRNANSGGDNATLWGWGNNIPAANESFNNSGGSILNMFQEVSMSARSGELLFRETHSNETRVQRLFKINKERRDALGVMGGATLDAEGRMRFPLFPINQPQTFTIPLAELSNFFSTSSPIPPQLLAGATLRLSLAKISKSITLYKDTGTLADGAGRDATVVDLNVCTSYLDQVDLFDSVNSMILSSANSLSTNGIQYNYYSNFNAIYPLSTSGVLDIQLSAARISSIVVKIVKKAPDDWKQSYVSESINSASATAGADNGSLGSMRWQFRLGNQVMPLYPIDSSCQAFNLLCDATSNISFASCEDPDSLKVINKLSPCAVSFADYTKTVGTTSGFGTGCFLVGLNMERSNALNISGNSTNNSRILTAEYSGLKSGDTFNAIVSVKYLQIANVTTSNVVVNR
jgi:hypothetical protein